MIDNSQQQPRDIESYVYDCYSHYPPHNLMPTQAKSFTVVVDHGYAFGERAPRKSQSYPSRSQELGTTNNRQCAPPDRYYARYFHHRSALENSEKYYT